MLGSLFRGFDFYQRYGVEECYQYDPDRNLFRGWMRRGEALEPIAIGRSWQSPRLEVRFELGDELEVYGRDGKRFAPYVEVVRQRDEEQREKEAAERARDAAERAKQTMEREKEAAQLRVERLAAQLRALGIEPSD